MSSDRGIRIRNEIVLMSRMKTRHHDTLEVGKANGIAVWLALIGLIIPAAEVQIYIGGAKFTVGRLGIMLLLVPALVALGKKGRRMQVTDFFAALAAVWIVIAGMNAGDSDSVSSSVAEAIEFCGGYFVARAFFFGPRAMETFIRVLKTLAIVAVVLGAADSLTGRLIVHDMIGSLLHVTPIFAQYREGMVRAASTFDHAILFGAFCSFSAVIFLYFERDPLRRFFYVGICVGGCLLSWSSSGLMSLFLAFSFYGYDRVMIKYPWRWTVIWVCISAIATIFFLAANNPMGWIVSHLTLDPQSGYFRFIIWDLATTKISEAPLLGFGFKLFNQPILDLTVDSVWLVVALRFGIPAVALIILMSFTAMLPVGTASRQSLPPGVRQLETGFSMVLMLFMFIGLTVHYWNYLWIFWGICIGIRTSLREYERRLASGHAELWTGTFGPAGVRV